MQDTFDVLGALLDMTHCKSAAILIGNDGYRVVVDYDEQTGQWAYTTTPHQSAAGALAEATGTVTLQRG